MRDIYASASTVLSWLGGASKDSDEAMAEIEAIARLFSKNFEKLRLSVTTPEQVEEMGFKLEEWNWSAIADLPRRKYWTRVWVLQELAASSGSILSIMDSENSRGIMGCGSVWISRNVLGRFVLFIGFLKRWSNYFLFRETSHVGPLRILEPGTIPALEMIGVGALVGENMHIAKLLRLTKFLNSSDPRDKVFALLGTANRIPGFSADYAKSTQQVYKELASSIILQDRNLDYLRGHEKVDVDVYPSWVMPKSGTMQVGGAWNNDSGFHCASGTENSDAQFDRELDRFRCSAILIGSLQTVIGPMETENLPANDAFYAYARNLGKAQEEDLWRTLIMDQDISDWETHVSPASSAFARQYDVFMAQETVPADFAPDVPEKQKRIKFIEPYLKNFDDCVTSRCVFVTKSGYFGLGPYLTKEGDVVAVLTGGDFCFVLRPKDDCFELVGEAYVHGVMKGELMVRDENASLVNGREFVIC